MSAENKIIKLLAASEIKDAMVDARFYEKLPEFLPLRAKIRALHVNIDSPAGCSSCKKKRVYNSLSGAFLTIVRELSDDGKERLKKYYGADELRATVLDPITKQPKTLKI